MKSHNQLAKGFMLSQPQEAARVLSNLPAEEVLAFFERIPVAQAAPVLNYLQHSTLAMMVQGLPVDKISPVLPLVSNSCATVILRNISKDKRVSLIRELPLLRRREISGLLDYPDTTVGAWVNGLVFTLLDSSDVGSVLDKIRRTSLSLGQKVFVLNSEHQLIGEVLLAELLQQPASQRIGNMMQPVQHVLRAKLDLMAALEYEGWIHTTELPVIDRKKVFLGHLSLHQLQQAIQPTMRAIRKSSVGVNAGWPQVFLLGTVGACKVAGELLLNKRQNP